MPPIPSDPYSLPLADIDVSNQKLYEADSHWNYFERLRIETPLHYYKASSFRPFWSVTRHKDLMVVDKDHETFSSYPGIVIGDQPPAFTVKKFIAMDRPDMTANAGHHTGCRAAQPSNDGADDTSTYRRHHGRTTHRRGV